MNSAAAIAAKTKVSWATRRQARGTKPSTSTPRQAPAKIRMNGISSPYSMVGAVISMLSDLPPPSTVGCGSVTPTCCMVASTAGSITSSIGFGKTPSSRISSTSGASASRSRPSRSSVIVRSTSGVTGPVIVRWYMIKM